jgi:di/tricarboxylate transporter
MDEFMTQAQYTIVAILIATMGMFLWGRWRHDMVAGGALLACVFTGLLPAAEAFIGFSHPAVITVACVLVLSHGLQNSGAVGFLTRRILPLAVGPGTSIFVLTILAAVLSGFMNNIGALALLMPLALQIASKQNLPPGRVLMPLAFGSILGGTTTLIGTPPNLIVSGFRAEAGMGQYGMFDFSPVGVIIAVAGVLFVGLLGWRLVPIRKQSDAAGFDTGIYLTEVRILPDSKAVGKTLREVEVILDKADAQIVGLARGEIKVIAPYWRRILRENDILIIEADPNSMGEALSSLGLKLEEEESLEEEDSEDAPKSKTRHDEEDTLIQELVVMPGSTLVGRSASDIELRTRYSINLLAISRQGRRSVKRLRQTDVQAGDVLLMQGVPEAVSSFSSDYNCVPLAERDIQVPVQDSQPLLAGLIFLSAVVVTGAGLLPVAISFSAAVLACMALRIVPPRSVYQAIDWSVIVLLGALLPVASVFASTGAADILASGLLTPVSQGSPIIALILVMVITMSLSDFMNNVATAAMMCPLALSIALQLEVNPDTFLMAVAIGASCAFLTPIGHQNNTLILGPGGFRFGDYWRLGLPLEILIIAVGTPALLWAWPL